MLKTNPIWLDGVDLGEVFAEVAQTERLGLAVSGGPDSLALMLLVRAWCDGCDTGAPEIFVYSVDHGLRPEAADEASFVLTTAENLGFQGRGLVWNGEKPMTGVQAAARAARYRLMGAAMGKDAVPILITAHHADDQAETVLMRMAHGSGITGLGGMAAWSEVEGVRVHRPLLKLRQSQLQQIVNRSGVSPVQDPSNTDSHYERVRWRQLAPTLEKHGLTSQGLSRLAERMQRADAALAYVASEAFSECVTRDPFGVAHLSAAAFSELPDEIALRVLAQMFASVGRDAPRLEQLEELLNAVGQSDFSGTCLSGAQILRHTDDIIICAELGRMDGRSVVLAPGDSLVWDRRFQISNKGEFPVSVDDSRGLTRAEAEQFTGEPIALPMLVVAAAPTLLQADGTHIALGLFTRSEEIVVKLV